MNALQARLRIDRRISTATETDPHWLGADAVMLADEIHAQYQYARNARSRFVTLEGVTTNVYIPIEEARMALFGKRGR